MNRVDAHHHIWDITTRVQPWMSAPGYEPMARSFTAADHAVLAHAAGVDASVVVQCVGEEAETLELLAVADVDPVIGAVVGWVDLTAPDVVDRIAALREAPGGHRLRGIRHQVHDEPDPDWLRRPDVQRGIRAVGAAGLAYDLLLKPPQMTAAIATVAELDDVPFVVDHAAKPPIASGEREPWASLLHALAEHEHVTCKLSGLTTEASWRSWMLDDLQPYVDVVLESFGPERVMAGSDWPVCTLATTYDAALRLADRFTDHLSPAERAAVLAGTARRVYRLDPLATVGSP
jgi:L-fuconolactonase